MIDLRSNSGLFHLTHVVTIRAPLELVPNYGGVWRAGRA